MHKQIISKILQEKKIWWLLQKFKHHIKKEKYYWHLNFINSEKAKMCFQSQYMNIKIIKTCFEKYQIMIRKAKVRFALKI